MNELKDISILVLGSVITSLVIAAIVGYGNIDWISKRFKNKNRSTVALGVFLPVVIGLLTNMFVDPLAFSHGIVLFRYAVIISFFGTTVGAYIFPEYLIVVINRFRKQKLFFAEEKATTQIAMQQAFIDGFDELVKKTLEKIEGNAKDKAQTGDNNPDPLAQYQRRQ